MRRLVLSLALLFAACSDAPTRTDAGTPDVPRARLDTGSDDAGPGDGGTFDSGDSDASFDAGMNPDASTDAGPPSDSSTYSHANGTARVDVVGDPSAERTYTLRTTADLRDNQPPDKVRTFSEQPDQPILRSGHDLFDALFALAVEEMRQNQVDAIEDAAFNNGAPVPCRCFETGELWKYVWTRDTAFSAHLSLAALDPERTKTSLQFKLSDTKASVGTGQPEIVQDTGSGGSYPVSTDRVAWALGAYETLHYLPEPERTAFRDRAYQAIVNTIETDRQFVYDTQDGLYRGEQSFLDWREQSYAPWTADDTVHIGMAKAASTNVLHHAILNVASKLALEVGDTTASTRYQNWANALATNIRSALWLPTEGMFASYTWTELDRSQIRKFDWLAQSLAVLSGAADGPRATEAISKYPHTDVGPPVLFPQQPFVPIYHNRAIWPFVTAYGLLAARATGNDAVVSHGVDSLVRGAALNLSNMENFEFLTQRPWVDDGAYSGPVVNSRRQLWSVAGYLSMVLKVVAGLEASEAGVRFLPFLTREVRARFTRGDAIELRQFSFHGKVINLRIQLPASSTTTAGHYVPGTVRLNGAVIGTDFVSPTQLLANNDWVVELVEGPSARAPMTQVPDQGDFRDFWSPRMPNLTSLSEANGQLTLEFDDNGESGVQFNVFRNGVEVASGIGGTSWTDPDTGFSTRTACYALESIFPNGHRSQHSPPVCYWGPGVSWVSELQADAFANVGGNYVVNYGRGHYEAWGDPGHSLELSNISPSATGEHLVQLVYGNGNGPINTGITGAMKWVTVTRESDAAIVGRGPIFMPHLGTWDRWADSSFLSAGLEQSETYRITITDGFNMSYFDHFTSYSGAGGGSEPSNRVNIATVRLLSMER